MRRSDGGGRDSVQSATEKGLSLERRRRRTRRVVWADARGSGDGALFGGWFASGKFDEKWAIERLAEFAAVVPPEPGHLVAERLAKSAGVDVGQAVGVLDVMVRADREGWRIQHWSRWAEEVLRVGMREGDSRTRDKARLMIDYLGRRGFTGFGALL